MCEFLKDSWTLIVAIVGVLGLILGIVLFMMKGTKKKEKSHESGKEIDDMSRDEFVDYINDEYGSRRDPEA